MKTIKFTKVLALLTVVSLPSVALAQVAGVPMPASVTAEAVIGTYTAVILGLLLVGDYSRRTRIALKSAAPCTARATTETHRLAA
ncbi:MAG: hypothetical protein JSS11_06130 [Verrucomicrobia bacterium]|nr:hypothetical protein [Verrucomicrobiota bacterium]